MPSVTLFPGTVTDSGGGDIGASWSNPNNVKAEDGAVASASLSGGASSDVLKCTDFDFASVIAADDVINGIQATFKKSATTSGSVSATIVDLFVQLLSGGAAVGSNYADTMTPWPSALTNSIYGSSTDHWGFTPTATIIRDPAFGIEVQASIASGAGTANIDVIGLTVWWSSQVSQNWTFYIDQLASVQKNVALPVEYLMAVGQTVKLLADLLMAVGNKTPLLLDQLASVAKNSRLCVETLSSADRTCSLPIENLMAVQQAWNAIVDVLMAVGQQSVISLDQLSPIVANCPLAIDVLASVLRTSKLPEETLATISRTGVIPTENLTTVETPNIFPQEWGGVHQVFGPDQRFPIESLGTAVSRTLLCAEWLSRHTNNVLTPAEWLATLRANELLPVDWGALPDPEVIWNANPRGRIWIASARGNVWVADERGTIWNPEKGQ